MSKTARSDLVAASDRTSPNANRSRQKFQFFERRSPASQFRKAYNRVSARSNQKHVPSLTLDESVIEKFENAKHPLTKSVRSITEKKGELETPRSINHFILYSSSNADLVAMATVIQRNWRISMYKRKLRRFLNFVLKVRRRRLSYALSMWILSTMPQYDRAKNSYNRIYKSLLSYNFLKKRRKKLIVKNSKMKLLTFEEYMKTNILYSIYPGDILVKYQKNLNRQLIQKLFQAWLSIASEHLILSKADKRSLIFAGFRENFGPEFWTYHVWKRWVYYKKKRKIELVETISANLYVPEWTYFRARKLTEARMRREATRHYRTRLGKTIIQIFRDEIHRRKTLKSSYESTVEYSNQLSLLFGYRAFQYLIIFKRFRQGCLIRALRAWYTIIDSKILNRDKLSIFTERIKMRIMRSMFKSWRKNIIEESVKNAFLHDQVSQNSLKLLPYVFLMKNNYVHFTYTKCFINWKKMIDKKKNLKRFVFWSIKIKKKQTLIRFILDIFKDNAHLPFKKSNYLPFCNNPDQGNFSHVSSQQSIMCPTSSVSETISAYQNVANFQMYQGDWSKFASGGQIRTLFYRLVCLLSYKKNINSNDIREKKIKMIKEFIKKKQLYNQRQVKTIYQMNDKKDKEMREGIGNILKRDVHVIVAYDAHSAAIELSNQVPNFSVNDEIRMISKSTEKSDDNELKKIESDKHDEEEEEDLNEDTYSISSSSTQGSLYPFRKRRAKVVRYSTPSIPFLRPINEVKDSLMKMTSKYRRRPKDAFSIRSISNRKTRQSFDMSSHRISAVSSHFGSFYEHFVQVQPDKSMLELMKSKDFSIKELQNLKRQITDAEIELEPIPEFEGKIEGEEVNDSDFDYEEIEEEEEIRDEMKDESLISENDYHEIDNNNKSQITTKTSLNDITKIRIGIHDHELIEENEEEEDKNENNKQPVKLISENSSKVEEITQSLDNQMITIDEMEKHFITDDQFNELDEDKRVSLLSNQYFDVIHLLLGTSNRPHANSLQFQGDSIQEQKQKTHVSKLLKKIAFKINEESQQSLRNLSKSKGKDSKKRVKLFIDPDQQFQEEVHSDGNTYQKSTCPEFTNVLFSGVTVLSNTPWQAETNSPEKESTATKQPSQASSLPSAENVVPGFDKEEKQKEKSKEPITSAVVLNDLRRRSSLFVEQNKEVKEQLEELINDETIDESIKIHVLQVIDKIATKYLRDEAERTKRGELTNFVDIDPESSTNEETSDESPVLQLRKSKKIKHFDERKFAAFDTESRERPPLHSFNGRRSHFYKDLALAVIECARFMSKRTIKHIDDIRNETSEYENLKFIKQIQQKQLNDAKRLAEQRYKQNISLNLPTKKDDEPVFTAAGVTKWTPPHKVQPTIYNSARSQKVGFFSEKLNVKMVHPTAFSSAVSSSSNVSNVSYSTSVSSKSTVTITGAVDDSSVQVPLIEITKFDIGYKAEKKRQKGQNKVKLKPEPSALQRVPLSSENRPKTQQSLMQRRIQMLQEEEDKKKELKKTKIKVSASFDRSKILPNSKSVKNKNKAKKETRILSKKITTINEIPVPIPVPDPMLMSQSSHSMKRKPHFTKYESVEPEPEVEFEFKPKTSRSLKPNSKYVKPFRPKWRPATAGQINGNDDLKYLVYVNPYVDHDNNEDNTDQNNNE